MRLLNTGDDILLYISQFLNGKAVMNFVFTSHDIYNAIYKDENTYWKIRCYTDFKYIGNSKHARQKYENLQSFEQKIQNMKQDEKFTSVEILPKEQYYLTEGKGVIKICGTFGEGIVIDENPLAYTWPDCNGSVGRYYLYCYKNSGDLLADHIKDDIDDFQNIAERGILATDESIASQIMIILKLLSNGNYTIHCEQYPVRDSIVMSDQKYWSDVKKDKTGYECTNYYGEISFIILTQDKSFINQERVDYYTRIIQNGQRPIIFLVGTQNGQKDSLFLINGHHKFEAYTNLQINAVAIMIIADSPNNTYRDETFWERCPFIDAGKAMRRWKRFMR
jgi:hypothetical protein